MHHDARASLKILCGRQLMLEALISIDPASIFCQDLKVRCCPPQNPAQGTQDPAASLPTLALTDGAGLSGTLVEFATKHVAGAIGHLIESINELVKR